MIQILPSEVVDQIAAGEVVDRPAHMVKELVENSIDAGASMIEIEYDLGGRRVRVTDDGVGIDPKDLPLALARHATSKISKAEDLWKLSSFGFRGEAMASIAAVSRMTLISRRDEKKSGAYCIKSEFGKIGPVESVGSNLGTTVLIEELFANVPARLKFLKSDTAEATQIKNTLKALALSHPEVEFRLKSNGKTVQIWPRTDDFLTRAEHVLEVKPLFENLSDFGGFRAHVAFASPHNVNGTARQIWLFVQNRWIQDRGLQAAVLDAYRGLLMHGEYPIVAARLYCPSDEIDVNIHPTKSAVKFRDSSSAFRTIHRCLREGLEAAPWLPKATPRVEAPSAEYQLQSPGSVAEVLGFKDPELSRTQYQKRDHQASPKITMDVLRAAAQASPLGENALKPAPAAITPAQENFVRAVPEQVKQGAVENSRTWSRLQVLGQAHLTYILAESGDTLFLVDQHAAHERVAFERLMRAWRDNQVERQDLLLPLTVDLELDVLEGLLRAKDDLSRLGVEIEQMGPGSLAIRAIPAGVKESAVVSSLADLGREIAENGGGFAFERKIADICATLACHSVVRAGQSLSVEQMQSLLEQMDEFPLSSFCPHGRPVSVELPFAKLERDFGRIV